MLTKYSQFEVYYGLLSLDRPNINQRTYYNPPNSAFWGWLSKERQPQNPEFRNNPENLYPWVILILSLDRPHVNQRTYYNLTNSAFWGRLSKESQPQNPEFRNNTENFHQWVIQGINCFLSDQVIPFFHSMQMIMQLIKTITWNSEHNMYRRHNLFLTWGTRDMIIFFFTDVRN